MADQLAALACNTHPHPISPVVARVMLPRSLRSGFTHEEGRSLVLLRLDARVLLLKGTDRPTPSC